MTAPQQDLEYWLKRVSEQEMPALANTIHQISKVANADQSHMSLMADLILKDPAMTMHVLRLTDSAYHIPRKNRQNTVTRALVMLGVNEVKSLCLSVSLFDPLLKKGGTQLLVKDMARAFHAAVQARYLAVTCGDRASEEVFIATLLRDIGRMAFLCFGGKKAEELQKLEEKEGLSREEAEKKVLGFELRELTGALSRKWGLGQLLDEAVSNTPGQNMRQQAISLGHRLARSAENGWDSAEFAQVAKEMSALTGMPAETVHSAIKKNTEEAVQVAESFGAHQPSDILAALSPAPAYQTEQLGSKESQSSEPLIFPPPDPMYQLNILRQISSVVRAGVPVAEVLTLILQGICKGVGMDRALFALLSPNRKYLRAKMAQGVGAEHLTFSFKFEMNSTSPSILDEVISQRAARWVENRETPATMRLIPPHIASVIGGEPFFIAPAIVDSQAIGVFFTDRSISRRPLDAEAFEAFRQFSWQADLAMEYLGKY